jgi:threonine synthase
MNIVAATSGDTGSAAICGVRGMERIRIFVMHPDGKTSEIQRLQMTTVLDDNVFNLAVRGSFDDCQRMLKEVFNDLDFKDGCSLGAVNSINWARVLAQVVYYFYASLRVCRERGADRVRFSVPTGNFGDIFAGYIAAKMGAPIGKLVLATNENDILARFFNSGEYSCGEVVPTISPSMDIQVASNFERYLYYRLDCDTAAVRDLMRQFSESGRIVLDKRDGAVDDLISADSGTTKLTLATIAECYENTGIVLDPHTAVGYSVGRRFTDEREPMIFLATAHPAKFGDAIRQALGDDAAAHPRLERLRGMPSRYDMLDADSWALKEYILRHI